MTGNPSDAVQTEFQTGKAAFERGDYRKAVHYLENACALVNLNSVLGGSIQTWLVTAYQATGQEQEAIALCRKLTQHPDWQTRKEGKRILYILEAPKLQTRPEWLTQIPDLGNLSDQADRDRLGTQTRSGTKPTASPPPAQYKVEPANLSQGNREDWGFIWVALIASLLLLGSLVWLM